MTRLVSIMAFMASALFADGPRLIADHYGDGN
jgi:hypothetical protein